ncbi:MAG: hypothetical protein EXR86_02225 [Gammaproteobacteria bacterium]|nr:hypothetical protein [Gammaproteobacteria bacterium]
MPTSRDLDTAAAALVRDLSGMAALGIMAERPIGGSRVGRCVGEPKCVIAITKAYLLSCSSRHGLL